ncbi:IPTL-CTERM sorting domain-containing protein [Acidovorax radicis]|uniref:IPTL-CTERM sorting domain-containing protein n=1 Tax=Acidovorax radicis TaxID=758826 RepID=UPI001CFC00D8|nr:IPTL-CTERM sorting domain-containing protein [Acidovorax radicis]UCV00370.1 IPTL-CTERM sorting domain-containing protein [Acidovorax radicis]
MPPTGWTHRTYTRSAVLPASPPLPDPTTGITLGQLGLSGAAVGNGASAIVTMPVFNVPATNPGTLTAPRWGNNALKLNDQGAKLASSIEQVATMTVAEVDPVDNKVHVRFGMAPVLVDGGHGPTEQPYFYVEVRNLTKNKVMFYTYNYANQSGVPWQTAGSYRYTDWQGFDIAPGNGQLDVGDQVMLIIYASNCSPGAAAHEARVYMDAVGAFMPGLAITSTGPSTTKPADQVTYTYSYANNSGVIALGSKVRVAAPKTEDGLFTTFVPGSWPASCTGPHTGVAPRSDYLECEVGSSGLLNDGQSGSFNVTFTVPAGAATSGSNAVVNNGDYDVRSDTASPFIGPLVKTAIVPAATPTTDLGVTVTNGGSSSYAPADTPVYTVTVTNHSSSGVTGASVSQTLTGVTGGNWTCAVPAGSTASCGATSSGAGPIATNTADVPPGQSLVYTYTGGTLTGAGTPANTVLTVTPPAGTQDTQSANNTAGMNTSVGTLRNVTANSTGAGTGHILAVPSGLACGNAGAACGAAGTTQPVAQGDEVRLTPVAHAGSLFKSWTGCTSLSGNTCVITVGATDVTATAEFARAYIVTPTLLPGGTMTSSTPRQVEDGTSTVFSITPNAGKTTYVLPPASGTACTGVLDTSVSPNTYTVNPVSANCGFTVAFTFEETSSVVGGNGTISPLGVTGPLVPGANNTVYTLTPSAGYSAVVGGTCKGTQDIAANTYTVANATTDCTVIASFTNDPVTVTSSVTGGNGSVDTTGTINLARGGSRTYNFSPTAGFYPLVTGNCPGTLVGNVYTVSPVNANCAFSVSFTNQTVNISSSVTSGTGTITPSGSTTVAQGGGQTFTATPGGGNESVFGGTCTGLRTGNQFTASNALADCSVQVKFIAAANAITVTATVPGGNGTVTTPGQNGAGETVLAIGDTRVWTLTPATAGMVPSVVAGSTCTGTLSATAPYTYTMTNATAACAVAFAFAGAGGQVASIPTLSEWGLIILSALIGLGMIGMRRRQMI